MGRVKDSDRIKYFREYLISARRAIEDGVNLKGYFAWTLLDNFEWECGFTERFGLVHVDFETMKRTPKDSFYFYKKLIKKKQ